MFRRRRNIHAKHNEWINVHRSQPQPIKRGMEPSEIIGGAVGIILAAMLVWELVKAFWPFLILLGIGAVVLRSSKKF